MEKEHNLCENHKLPKMMSEGVALRNDRNNKYKVCVCTCRKIEAEEPILVWANYDSVAAYPVK